MGSLERYPRPNLKILSTNERDETVRERLILNFFRNILEVTKLRLYISQILKKKPTASFARICKEEYCNYRGNMQKNKMAYF